ncbi:YezD family protein [Pseudalkalibacillus berkeleyi]|uniref:YezD family protein n=1 Tax=Pseudalkalibacillus berkeleyi TaxID=1069813 RepID=A0ABS9H101_9BACL|nr:YezD family protein [Pseudalkalibacillus berkeleyi]MCF6137523.1 YezD family protein [Pseudalkalibacillus berkeleyi]
MAKEVEALQAIVPRLNKMLESMDFGSVTLVVQDGKVIQIEKNEKVRLK